MQPIVQAAHLEKRFHQAGKEDFVVLKDISLSLIPCEIVCLLGASGSGKTTLLRILAGLDLAFGGVLETRLQHPGPQLGYLSQNDRLLPWRSVVENVALGPELLGENKKTAFEKAFVALCQVGMGEGSSDYPSALSGGMVQRVLLARALVTQPRLLLMDEPMSNLDVLARRELSLHIKKYVQDHAAAALVVTHSVEEACFLGNRVLLLTRAPAVLFKELRLDEQGASGALDAVMKDLLSALGTEAA